jgi:hypothetical protein
MRALARANAGGVHAVVRRENQQRVVRQAGTIQKREDAADILVQILHRGRVRVDPEPAVGRPILGRVRYIVSKVDEKRLSARRPRLEVVYGARGEMIGGKGAGNAVVLIAQRHPAVVFLDHRRHDIPIAPIVVLLIHPAATKHHDVLESTIFRAKRIVISKMPLAEQGSAVAVRPKNIRER